MTVCTRVRSVLSGWFTEMCRRHYGRDYGNELRNRYFFYRRTYGMTASQAWFEANRSHG